MNDAVAAAPGLPATSGDSLMSRKSALWSLGGPTLSGVGDEEFVDYIASRLAGLRGVAAVSLGGSRASGASRPDSDWDFAVYYRGRFDPDDLGALGWPGEVSAIGGWGGGVFNGGAWLRVEGRPVDVHYRDLDDVGHRIAEAREGRFRIERLMFHLAGIPTYIVAAELVSPVAVVSVIDM
jgi:predicted nucleotidyltransferase